MTNEEIIVNALKQKKQAMSAGQIAELTGIDRKNVDKAMKVLKDTGAIVSPRRCSWTVK